MRRQRPHVHRASLVREQPNNRVNWRLMRNTNDEERFGIPVTLLIRYFRHPLNSECKHDSSSPLRDLNTVTRLVSERRTLSRVFFTRWVLQARYAQIPRPTAQTAPSRPSCPSAHHLTLNTTPWPMPSPRATKLPSTSEFSRRAP